MSAPLKCLIVDDEPAAHYVLQNYIGQKPQLSLSGQCYNGFEAANYLSENKVDLMFLDIDMPELTGLELLKELSDPPKTILTTAYSEFALESYDYGVIDYLLKPIYFPRFEKAIERFLSLLPESAQEKTPQQIQVKVDGNLITIGFDQLLYAQSYGNYVKIFTPAKTWLASMTTNELENALPSSLFMRVHKSYIISLDKISRYERDSIFIGADNIPVGITYRRELAERLRNS